MDSLSVWLRESRWRGSKMSQSGAKRLKRLSCLIFEARMLRDMRVMERERMSQMRSKRLPPRHCQSS